MANWRCSFRGPKVAVIHTRNNLQTNCNAIDRWICVRCCLQHVHSVHLSFSSRLSCCAYQGEDSVSLGEMRGDRAPSTLPAGSAQSQEISVELILCSGVGDLVYYKYIYTVKNCQIFSLFRTLFFAYTDCFMYWWFSIVFLSSVLRFSEV